MRAPRPPAHRLRAPGRVLGGDARAGRGGGRGRARRGRAAARLARVRRRAGDGRPDGRRRRCTITRGSAAERELVARRSTAGRPFLGVCLGVAAAGGGARRPRLRGRAAGGRAARGRAHRRRAAPTRCSPGSTSRWSPCSGTATPSTCPDGAVRLARSPMARNQAFRVGERAYGVQFHLEVTGEMAREWATIPAYRALAGRAPSASERGAEFIAAVERRADELHPPARDAVRELARARRRAGIGGPSSRLYNFVHNRKEPR